MHASLLAAMLALQAKAHSAERGFQDQLAHERSRADALTLEVCRSALHSVYDDGCARQAEQGHVAMAQQTIHCTGCG